jgi:acetyltransferase-like isoleucine patch superfamily enzyme
MMQTDEPSLHVHAPPPRARVRRALARCAWILSRLAPLAKSRLYYPLVLKRMGRGTVIERPTLLFQPHCIEIGARTAIRRGVRLEAVVREGFEAPLLTIGDGCLIEQNVQIICKGRVSIGNDVSVAGHCAIVDVTHPIGAQVANIGTLISQEDSPVVIEDGCFLGFGTVVLPGVRLARGCVVGANSVVTASFGPRSVIAGAPARLIRTY